jgi:methionyl-tRNA formyltransferase
MRIVFIGQAPFGAEALIALRNQGEQIVGVITTPDSPGQKGPNPVQVAAAEHGLPLLRSRLLKQPEAVAWVQGLAPDLLVLAFVTSFVPAEMIAAARLGGINYHPSLLPKYRGGSAINWAIINGETETGVTIHCIDQGVDTGPILLQERVAIDPDDTVKSLYFGKLYPMGIRMICQAVAALREGTALATPQDATQASFQPVISPRDTIIDWHQPTQQVYNLIRGANPSPGASTSLRGENWRIIDAIPGSGGGEPGRVVYVGPDQFTVATGDGAIVVQTVQPPKGKKIIAGALVAANSLQLGDRFGDLA